MLEGFGEHEPGWSEVAACRGVGWDRFFPEARRGQPADYSAALALCGACAVRSSCLAYAVEVGAAEGVWGGTTPAERKRLRLGA